MVHGAGHGDDDASGSGAADAAGRVDNTLVDTVATGRVSERD